jgi:adenylate cyclase
MKPPRTPGSSPALIERIWASLGFSPSRLDAISDDDVELLRYASAVLAAGFPLVAFLQLIRVYGQSLAAIADAEVRLFHLYVHEPLIRDGVPGLEMAEEMEGLAGELLPLASPIMDQLHQRFLHHFVEQDVVGHIETEGELDLGRVRVTIAFADLAGYTRLTEEAGEEQAVGLVERFVESVADTLPEDARVVKTIGDEVMVVGTDAAALLDWAVAFQREQTDRPLPRIGMHRGAALYRDGDYYGRAVNLAARVGARAAGGEVLVTREVVEAAGRGVEFERIGEVKLKGFDEATELQLAWAEADVRDGKGDGRRDGAGRRANAARRAGR